MSGLGAHADVDHGDGGIEEGVMALLAGGKRGSADRAAMGSSRPGDVPDIGTLRQLWRFREYGRAELRSLLLGTAMRGLELVADLAAPWPLALVINGLQNKNKQTGVLGYFAAWFGGSAVAMLVVAAVATLVFTALSALFDYLGDRIMSSSIPSAACSVSSSSRPVRASSRLPALRAAARSRSGKKAPWRSRVSIRPSV